MIQTYKPGQISPCSCDYKVVDASGNEISRNISVDSGESFPPTPEKNQHYVRQ